MIFYYLKYVIKLLNWSKSKYSKGELILDLITKPTKVYHDDHIRLRQTELMASNNQIEVKDLGAGSKVSDTKKRSVSQVAKYASIRPGFGQFYAQLISKLDYQNSIELGTSFGIGTAYLALTSKHVVTIEGCEATARIADETFKQLNLNQVDLLVGEFSTQFESAIEKLKTVDFIYIDGNHTYEATLAYFRFFKMHCAANACFILDDIYWSRGMQQAWQDIKKEVGFTIDLCRVGLVLMGDFEQPEHHTKWLKFGH